jgi:hypothetical protein
VRKGLSLPTISELISLDFTPEVKKRKKAKVSPLSVPLDWPDDSKPPSRYEYHVFKFLLENKDTLGIQTVFKFENLRVDGAILLLDKRRLAIEIKLRMNWMKACQAQYQFGRFLLTDEAKTHPAVSGAIVFFEDFEGNGWEKRPKYKVLEDGWNNWYTSHFKVEGHRLDLFRLRQQEFDCYKSAYAAKKLAQLENL